MATALQAAVSRADNLFASLPPAQQHAIAKLLLQLLPGVAGEAQLAELPMQQLMDAGISVVKALPWIRGRVEMEKRLRAAWDTHAPYLRLFLEHVGRQAAVARGDHA